MHCVRRVQRVRWGVECVRRGGWNENSVHVRIEHVRWGR